jgi:hypothetical protein
MFFSGWMKRQHQSPEFIPLPHTPRSINCQFVRRMKDVDITTFSHRSCLTHGERIRTCFLVLYLCLCVAEYTPQLMYTMMDVRQPFLRVSQFCWESADNDGCQMIMNSGVKKGEMFMVYSKTILTSRPVFVFWNWFW